MSLTELVIWLSAGLLTLAVAVTGAFLVVEMRRPPVKGRLHEIIAAAAAWKKGPCP